SCWSPDTPFFAPVQGGLEGAGAEAVDRVADLELGLTQELIVGLGGEQASEAAGLIQEGLLEGLEEALGFGFLVGGEVHAGLLRRAILGCVPMSRQVTRFPAHLRDAYPPSRCRPDTCPCDRFSIPRWAAASGRARAGHEHVARLVCGRR